MNQKAASRASSENGLIDLPTVVDSSVITEYTFIPHYTTKVTENSRQ